jgi:hypothetical protein
MMIGVSFRFDITKATEVACQFIKRIAYGYRDDQYFFLKIRAAFPGILP